MWLPQRATSLDVSEPLLNSPWSLKGEPIDVSSEVSA
jgi:hypothetical protein